MFLISCGKPIQPSHGYSQIKSRNYIAIDEIIAVENKAIKFERYYESSLNLDDSVLVYDDTIYSNYKGFSFRIRPQKTDTLKVSSICHKGFDKDDMFNPEMFVINNEKQKIEVKCDSSYFDASDFGVYQPEGVPPMFALNKIWTIKSVEEIKCTFLVFSNNQNLTKVIFE